MILHGNAHFLRRFLLCVFCLAVFSLARADVVDSKTITVSFMQGGYGLMTAVIRIDERYTEAGVYTGHAQAYKDNKASGYPSAEVMILFQRFGSSGFFQPYNGLCDGPSGSVIKIYNYYGSGNPDDAFYFTVGSGLNRAVEFTAKLTNYSSSPQAFSIMAGTTSVGTGTIPANGSIDQLFEFTAAENSLITIVPEPTYASNYDPAVVSAANNVFERTGFYGTPAEAYKVRFMFINYGSGTVPVDIYATTTLIGHCDAAGGLLTEPPKTTTYDYEISLPSDTMFTFGVPDGHTASYSSFSLHSGVNTFVVSIDRGDDQPPPSFGGGGLIGEPGEPGEPGDDPEYPSGGGGVIIIPPSEGRPGSVVEPPITFNPGTGVGLGGPVVGTGTNATDAASLGYLKEIEENTRKTSDVSDAQKKGADGLEDKLKSVDAQAEHDAAVADATLIGDAATEAKNSLPVAGLPDIQESDPGDPYVDMLIAPGRTTRVYLNPFSSNGPLGTQLKTVAAWIKRLIAYGLVLAFMIRVTQEIRLVIGTIFLTNPTQSQVVDIVSKAQIFGNSAGVPIALGLRVLMIALTVSLLATIPLLIIAALEAGLPFPSFATTISASPTPPVSGGSVIANAYAYSCYLVPWATVLAVPVWYYLLHQLLFPLQVFWQALMRRLP